MPLYRSSGASLASLVAADGATGGFIKDSEAGNLPATATDDDADAGKLGEYLFTEVLAASQVQLTTATAKTIATLTLEAGDYMAHGNVSFAPAGTTTIQSIIAAIHTTTDELPTAPGSGAFSMIAGGLTTGANQRLFAGTRRISLASQTNIFLIGQSTFGVSTMHAYGFIGAWRIR